MTIEILKISLIIDEELEKLGLKSNYMVQQFLIKECLLKTLKNSNILLSP